MTIVKRLLSRLVRVRKKRPPYPFAVIFDTFRTILKQNNRILELIADMGEKLGGEYVFDRQYIISMCEAVGDEVYKLIYNLNLLGERRYHALYEAYERIRREIEEELAGRPIIAHTAYVLPLDLITRDSADEAGGKAANLGEIKNVLSLPTPEGFVITTKAFQEITESLEIDGIVQELRELFDRGEERKLLERTKRLKHLIMDAKIPKRLSGEIEKAVNEVTEKTGTTRPFFAVRSSAWLEDSQHSFAGILRSVLNVRKNAILDAYFDVLSSLYSYEALTYRFRKGIKEHESLIAVLCQVMIYPRCSGVLYTLDPLNPAQGVMRISASWGLGPSVVEGRGRADEFTVDRTAPYSVISMRIVKKESQLVAVDEGGVEWRDVPEEQQYEPCLHSPELSRLADMGMLIERYFKRPQDIEWALDRDGSLYILQARPLIISKPEKPNGCDLATLLLSAPVIMSGKGAIVHQGVAAGRVFVLEDLDKMDQVPHGSILVVRHTSPRLARLIRHIRGIIADYGSPTGHLATIAREFRIPMLVGTESATEVLKTGMEITLDTTQNAVFRGVINELCLQELTEETVFEESYEYRLLRRVLKKMSPLTLLDPQSSDFIPQRCRTYHDITRYVHEKAVDEIIRISETYPHEVGSRPRMLVLPIPLGLFVVDIGGGLHQSQPLPSKISPGDIACTPLSALLEGLLLPGIWSTEPVEVDFGSLMSSVTKTFSYNVAAPDQIGRNLVVISRDYMNLNLRLGYHFNIVDAYITENQNDNYIYFRFAGGVTDDVRKSRRARCIGHILDTFDFVTEVRGDLIVGRVKKLNRSQMYERMKILGALIGYTRQLDTQMDSDALIFHYADRFVETLHSLTKVKGGEHGCQAKNYNTGSGR
ncbi:PEP/pyruvate-binding domain-containing protein [Thermodesulforhabdus norvegica]|uniref:Phosphoenolpyruvate synthase n=1 Tax=Thermodesulforhabdus norvegica TaxID=39841 RepID=A0A1I4SWZ0_9BACT|nr:PEP/pyruvate-binding domain-containing protein [Thermodesulforhabdus norvegica]SFM68951.1 pyruvate, water dikinase [Thermodesulforhabdus norvegica]